MEPASPPIRAWPRRGVGLVLAGLVLLAGCKVTEDFGHADRQQLAGAEPLPVTLSPELHGLRKRSVASGGRTVYKVGHLLRRLFPGSDGRAFLSLVSSDIEVEEEFSGIWSGHYELEVMLQLDGEHHPIRVNGLGESPAGARVAGKLAIEDSVEQVYQRLFVLVGPMPAALASPAALGAR
jgi:hypothetical protein